MITWDPASDAESCGVAIEKTGEGLQYKSGGLNRKLVITRLNELVTQQQANTEIEYEDLEALVRS